MIEQFNKEILPVYIHDYEEYKKKIGVKYLPEYEQMNIELEAYNSFSWFCGDPNNIYINKHHVNDAEKYQYDWKGKGYYLIGFKFDDHLANPELNSYRCVTCKYSLKEYIKDVFRPLQKMYKVFSFYKYIIRFIVLCYYAIKNYMCREKVHDGKYLVNKYVNKIPLMYHTFKSPFYIDNYENFIEYIVQEISDINNKDEYAKIEIMRISLSEFIRYPRSDFDEHYYNGTYNDRFKGLWSGRGYYLIYNTYIDNEHDCYYQCHEISVVYVSNVLFKSIKHFKWKWKWDLQRFLSHYNHLIHIFKKLCNLQMI